MAATADRFGLLCTRRGETLRFDKPVAATEQRLKQKDITRRL